VTRRSLAVATAIVIGGALVVGGVLMTSPLVAPSRSADPLAFPVPTLPPPQGSDCHDAGGSGTLARHPQAGLVLAEPGQPPLFTFWPHGYFGRLTEDGADLLDGDGRVVARTGDRVNVGGGMIRMNGLEGFGVCHQPIDVRPARP
jgi:hypothetical protein